MKNRINRYLPIVGRVIGCGGVITLFALGMTEMAWAQLSTVNNVATMVADTLKAGGVAVAGSAIMSSGYKVAFQGARFEDVSKVVIGGGMIGGGMTAAGFLVGGA